MCVPRGQGKVEWIEAEEEEGENWRVTRPTMTGTTPYLHRFNPRPRKQPAPPPPYRGSPTYRPRLADVASVAAISTSGPTLVANHANVGQYPQKLIRRARLAPG